jgi:predicted GIY-YIG superfamily endonuclease
VGVTNDLSRRIGEHKDGIIRGFTKRYKVDKLVYYEEHQSWKLVRVSGHSSVGAENEVRID